MVPRMLRIGTRESQLAVWQATLVQDLLRQHNISSELVYIKSEGDIDTVTPLYELGVQGIFTKTLDAALLGNKIDIAVHSMKDVPTIMARGIRQAAVLQRASYKDILVYREGTDLEELGFVNGRWTDDGETSKVDREINKDSHSTSHDLSFAPYTIATSSIRRKAQWLHRFPGHRFENLRGNVNTRLRKLAESRWQGAIFAAAGLERIQLRPEQSVELDWMLPAPAQGAIVMVCRESDEESYHFCAPLNHTPTELATRMERDFLRGLMGGCATPISALAEIKEDTIFFKGNIISPDGTMEASVEQSGPVGEADRFGIRMANEIRIRGGQKILDKMKKGVTS